MMWFMTMGRLCGEIINCCHLDMRMSSHRRFDPGKSVFMHASYTLVETRGKFMWLDELRERMGQDQFVPGGLKAWQEVVDRNIHLQHLK